MAKNKKISQGHIIDEIRKTREKVWTECHGDTKKIAAHAKKFMKKLGIKMEQPRIQAKSLKEWQKTCRKKSNDAA